MEIGHFFGVVFVFQETHFFKNEDSFAVRAVERNVQKSVINVQSMTLKWKRGNKTETTNERK